tara:strand:+ start:15777 stop:16463 length:687 start_codon:yes stop_codon:yes gene_type:complete
MATFERSDLITRVRRRADQENSEFVTDDELTDYLNRGLSELWDIIVMSFQHYSVSTTEFTTPSTTAFSLPDDFYKLIGVDFTASGTSYATRVLPFQFQHRNTYQSPLGTASGLNSIMYQLVGDEFKVIPEDSPPAGTIKLWYIPVGPQFSDVEDTVSGIPPGYEDYAVTFAVIQAKAKEESDIAFEVSNLERLKLRIEQAARRRDAGEAKSIVNVGNGTEFYHDVFFR